MNLQDAFYIIGIICMSLYTLFLIVMVILLFYIKKKINDLTDIVEKKIEIAKEITNHPKRVAASIGAAVATKALSKTADIIRPKKKRIDN